jgi:Leucine-rich repeat (LRR) protein
MKNPINLKLTLYTLLLMLLMTCNDDDAIQYELSTLCTPDKTGTVTPESGMFNEGTEIELKAAPIQEYIFKNWAGDAGGNENPLKIIMLEDKNITAVFEKVNYSLTIEIIGEGTVNQEIVLAKSSSADYDSGTTVQLTAVPDDEWKFVEWSGDHTGTENPIQLKMDQAMTITAKFEKVSYSLAIEIKGNGTVNEAIIQAKSASTDYESGTTVQLTAVPEDQWEFVGWSGDYIGAENPIQITIDKPMSIVATFEVENLEKTYVPDDNFEKALIELGYDDQIDDYVYNQRIRNVEELLLEDRQIEDLTGIEGFENLKILNVTNNNLQILDVSLNSLLSQLFCDNNQLTSMDISQNHNLGLLRALENEFNCVRVNQTQLFVINIGGLGLDGPSFIVDIGVTFSIDCGISNEDKTYVPDNNFEQTLIDLGLDDVLDNYVKTIDILYIDNLNISNKNISDLTGLEDFKSLMTLDAHNNNISLVDPFLGSTFIRALAAGTIILSDNNISNLDISAINCLALLDVRNNPLTCIQVNEYQLSCIEGFSLIIMKVKTDEGVTTSLDCGN